MLHPLALMIMDGRLHTAVDAVVPMREFKQAIARAQESGRAGKVILDFTNV